ncbi:MAG: amicyanin [Nitrobacter sp. 62-13]|uniref:cupredoxin domain-containing protein n=1 Tax=Nitrobacter sp. 62-13 TaxID=1895797 RepID=UPI00095C4F51|nr:cupredoxin domain-containing protein [Nitrobacter sp. 62-13]OJU28835.1 MAG: amicyanin [Nitrobacter sp. 62-13]
MKPAGYFLIVAAAGLALSGIATLGSSVPAHAATVQITMRDLEIAPAAADAKVGDTIEWVNDDIFVHSATARNGDWDVTLPPNKTVRLVLKKAGAIDYYCRFHPNMKARLTISP